MNNLISFIQSKYIYIPFLLWFVIQLYKFLYELVKTKKLNFKRLVGAGGMPSSHSAIVSNITTLIGKYEGLDSSIFALSLIMSFIVMYDACGVRRAAGKQAAVLNKIVATPGMTGLQISEKLIEMLGHTPFQVIVGAVIGIIVGSIA